MCMYVYVFVCICMCPCIIPVQLLLFFVVISIPSSHVWWRHNWSKGNVKRSWLYNRCQHQASNVCMKDCSMHNMRMYLYTDTYVDCIFHFACMKFLVTINLGMRTYVFYVCVMNSLLMYISIISFLQGETLHPSWDFIQFLWWRRNSFETFICWEERKWQDFCCRNVHAFSSLTTHFPAFWFQVSTVFYEHSLWTDIICTNVVCFHCSNVYVGCTIHILQLSAFWLCITLRLTVCAHLCFVLWYNNCSSGYDVHHMW